MKILCVRFAVCGWRAVRAGLPRRLPVLSRVFTSRSRPGSGVLFTRDGGLCRCTCLEPERRYAVAVFDHPVDGPDRPRVIPGRR